MRHYNLAKPKVLRTPTLAYSWAKSPNTMDTLQSILCLITWLMDSCNSMPLPNIIRVSYGISLARENTRNETMKYGFC